MHQKPSKKLFAKCFFLLLKQFVKASVQLLRGKLVAAFKKKKRLYDNVDTMFPFEEGGAYHGI